MKLLKRLFFIICITLFCACEKSDKPNNTKFTNKDYTEYHTTKNIDSLVAKKYYVPVYSDIYSSTEKIKIQLTVTLSIRNIDTEEKMYIKTVDYYDSHGNKIRTYLQQPIELNPLQSVDFVVHEKDKSGGSGAGFVVNCVTNKNNPVVQAVMIGTLNQQGISYLTNGVVLK